MQPYTLIPKQGGTQADEWLQLGVEAQVAGKTADAERFYKSALRVDPQSVSATQNLAVLLAQVGNLNEALLTIERAAMWDGTTEIVHVNRALMALEADWIDLAVECSDKALKIGSSPEAKLARALVLGVAARPREALDCYNEILTANPKHAVAGLNSCFVQTLTGDGPEKFRRQRAAWREVNKFAGPVASHHAKPHSPLRVGYVGGDFKTHSAAMIFGNVVLGHDQARVLPYLYSNLPVNPEGDAWTKKFREAAGDRWRDIAALTDEQADALVRKDEVDVLVDLAAHTAGGRLSLFLRKPAPVQVTAWGFAHGTGCPEVDYFFADPVVVPPEDGVHYAEKIFHLPCVVTYREPKEYNLPDGGVPPCCGNGFVTFGSFARYEKMSEQCLRAFGEVLKAVPGSKLLLKDHGYRRPYAVRRVTELVGVEPSRLQFAISSPHVEHMLAYRQCDVVLDPFPHTGGVVSMEQLYMGLPVVTLYGPHPGARTTSSVLTAMGRKGWVATTPENYVGIAVALAQDAAALSRLRKTLRQELLESPVVAGYCGKVEDAYESMVKR